MEDQTNDVLVKRLERLERSNRRLKLLSFVALAAIGTMGAAKGVPHNFDVINAKQINAQGISIIDANGKLRISIGADPASEQAGLTVFQRDGVARSGIGIDPENNAATGVNDPSGTNRAAVVALADNRAVILTFGPDGNFGTILDTDTGTDNNIVGVFQPDGGSLRAFIAANPVTTAFGIRHHSTGDLAMFLFDQADGSSRGMFMRDVNNTTRINIGDVDSSTPNPAENIQILGADGITRASMESGSSSNNGKVATFDSSGTQTGILGGP